MKRSRRRMVEATAWASVVSGAPSPTHALLAGGDLRSVVDYGVTATGAIGTLVPPGRPGLARGAIVHFAVSVLVGELLARSLPRRHSVLWGALAGAVVGWANLGVARRWFPAIAQLPLGPQLADNVAFGAVFAAVADR